MASPRGALVGVATSNTQRGSMDVGVRALKERLSEYIERAARGELIIVTDGGEPKAMLGPLPGRLSLDQGIAEGWIRQGSGEPPVPARRFKPRLNSLQALGEDRGE